MDKRKAYYMVLDTETVKIDPSKDINGNNALVYDIGYRIIDKHDHCYVERNYLVNEIFLGMWDKFISDYYNKDKRMKYYNMLACGEIELKSFYDIYSIFMNDLKQYHVKYISMHNAKYDYNALNKTARVLSNYKMNGWFNNIDIEIIDTYAMALDTICKYKTYPYKTKTGRASATAENLYKYISHDSDFVESHTALNDTVIESAILLKCIHAHKPMRKHF